MKAKIHWVFMTVVLVAALSIVGLAATDTKTFVFVTIAGADSLDPAYCYDTASGEVIHHCYDNLIAYEGDSLDQFKPMLATEVPSVENGLMSEDGKTITFPIRENVKFHNGNILTPEDVKYSFVRAMLADPDGGPNWMLFEPLIGNGIMSIRDVIALVGGSADFADISEVPASIRRKAFDRIDQAIEVSGDSVTFHLAAPYPPFLQILCKGCSWGSIVNKDWMIENGAWDGDPDTWHNWYNQSKEEMTLYEVAMGTGPFTLQTWDRNGGQLIFKRFDDYWQGPAALETVFIKYIDEESTRILMLKNGEADAVFVNRQFVEQVTDVPGITVQDDLPAVTNTTLIFNWTIPVKGNEAIVGSGKLDGNGIPSDFFADVHVRRAFCCSFDYEAYLSEVAMGKGFKPYGPAPAVLPYVNEDQPFYFYDLEQAEAEFKAAFNGKVWENGFKLTILYNSGNEARKTAAEILEAAIESLNPKFQIEVQAMDWPNYLTKLRASALPVFFMGWHMDYPDAHNFYHPYMHSAGVFAGYCGKALVDVAKREFDPLIEQGIAEIDPDKRQEIYYKLQQLAYDYAVGVFYVEPVEVRVFRSTTKGWSYHPAYSAHYDYYTLSKSAEGVVGAMQSNLAVTIIVGVALLAVIFLVLYFTVLRGKKRQAA